MTKENLLWIGAGLAATMFGVLVAFGASGVAIIFFVILGALLMTAIGWSMRSVADEKSLLFRNAIAPISDAMREYSCSLSMLMRAIATPGYWSCMRLVASKPFITGICTSIKIRSGLTLPIKSRASLPSPASATTRKSPSISRIFLARLLKGS